jgi:hypothetical protein
MILVRAQQAFQLARFTEATALGLAAFDRAANSRDPAESALIQSFEPTLALIFLQALGSVTPSSFTTAAPAELTLSPRTAFLMSRLGPGMCVADAFDVASMPRLETLRRLLALVRCGAVYLDRCVDAAPPAVEKPGIGTLAHAIVARPFR